MSDHSVLPFPLYLVQKTLGGNYVPLTYDCCKTHLKRYFKQAHQTSEFGNFRLTSLKQISVGG